jgi:hypothetical protein
MADTRTVHNLEAGDADIPRHLFVAARAVGSLIPHDHSP